MSHISRIIHTVSAQAEGEVGDVITGGVACPPGDTLWDRRDFLERDGVLRDFMLNEPRGGVFRHVNLLVPPVAPEADAAFLIMEPEDTPPMSGSNCICVATVLLETGIVEMVERVTDLVLEVPAGLVRVRATCEKGKVTQVAFANVPSFVDRLDASVEVEGVGTVQVSTGFGGDSYAIVDASSLGFEIAPHEARDLAQTGDRITDAVNEQLGFSHPEAPWNHVSFCQFAAPLEKVDGVLEARNTVVIKPGKLDRSPCGTGSSARMAVMHAKGQLQVGERFVTRSVIGSRFECRILEEVQVGGKAAIVPEIAGRAWITGTHQHMLDAGDPWPRGYRVGDTWPGA